MLNILIFYQKLSQVLSAKDIHRRTARERRERVYCESFAKYRVGPGEGATLAYSAPPGTPFKSKYKYPIFYLAVEAVDGHQSKHLPLFLFSLKCRRHETDQSLPTVLHHPVREKGRVARYRRGKNARCSIKINLRKFKIDLVLVRCHFTRCYKRHLRTLVLRMTPHD